MNKSMFWMISAGLLHETVIMYDLSIMIPL